MLVILFSKENKAGVSYENKKPSSWAGGGGGRESADRFLVAKQEHKTFISSSLYLISMFAHQHSPF